MPYAFPYPVIYSAGAAPPHGQKTERGLRVLMYSYLVGGLVALAAGLEALAPSASGSTAAFCFGFLLAVISLLMGLVALVRIFSDRASFGEEHSRHVRLALAFFVCGFVGIVVTAVYGTVTFPDARDAVSTPGFSFASVVPRLVATALLGWVFSLFSFLGAYFLLRGLVPEGDLRLLRGAVVFAFLLDLAISLSQVAVFAASVPGLNAAAATRSAARVDSVLDAYFREAGLLDTLALFYDVLLAYVAFLALKGFPALREKHSARAAPQVMPFVVAAPMPTMLPILPGYPAHPGYAVAPPGVSPAAPPPSSPALEIQPVRCPRCQQPAEFVPQHNRYYCRTCSGYV